MECLGVSRHAKTRTLPTISKLHFLIVFFFLIFKQQSFSRDIPQQFQDNIIPSAKHQLGF